jgi:hypothetical protein
MPTSTFTPGDEKQDEKLNPGQRDADRRFSDLSGAEKRGTVDMSDFERNYGENADSSQEDANIKKLQEQESSSAPSAGWKNNVEESSDSKKGGRAKGWFKKASPALGIGGVLGIGGFMLLALTSPSLLIVQLKETMVGRFNTQLSSMEARSNKILYAKMNGATSGFCNSKISIRCKFTTMSEKQVAKMKAAGIEVVPAKTGAITGRVKPASLKFNNIEVTANNFASLAGSDADFRSALKQAYNPKYAGFVGKAWANVASRFKISKQAPELNAEESREKARTTINEIAQEGTEDTGSRVRVVGDAECEGTQCITEEDANKMNEDIDKIKTDSESGGAASSVRERLSGINTGAVSSFFKITGPVDAACQVYGGLTTLSYAAKAIRAAQLVRYAMLFIGVADSIKAGSSPEPKDVELLGSILTTTVRSQADPNVTLVGSATDSFGYKYAAYGDSGSSEESMKIANRFISGGGFVGEMSAVTNAILTPLGGRTGAKNTCGFLANPVVQGASIVVGIASLFVPGANIAKIAISAGANIGVSLAIAVLPGMLADIVAGTVTNDIVGEESGNAIVSGSGALMSDALAAQNGNAPMSKEDAIAYNSLQTATNDQYIADELRNTNPLDATNAHTFLGSIVAALIPLQSSSNPLTTVGSLLSSSMANIVPESKALSDENYAKTLNLCQDMDVAEGGYAADPFCNVIRGIPPQYLNKDPLKVVDELVATGDLTEDGEPAGKYPEFIDLCITNEEPLGYKNADTGFDANQVKSCVINDSNANYYLNYVDQRVELGLSGEDEEASGPSSVANLEVDEANLFTDSSSIACAAGTESAGINTGYRQGKPITIQVCKLPNTALQSGGPALVNSRASGVAYAMFEKMRTDLGIEKVTLNDSFRTMAEQQEAKATYGGQAATPGWSNHQMGYAFDVNMGAANGGNSSGYRMNVNTSYPGNKVWEWLKANASTYHFSQYAPEGWHWSINGG